MFCPYCKLSMTLIGGTHPLIQKACKERDYPAANGIVEAWRCSDSRCQGFVEYTEWCNGRRVRTTSRAGEVIVLAEV